MLTEYADLNRRLSERLGYQLTSGFEEVTNRQRAEMLSQGFAPETVEELLYQSAVTAKSNADAEFDRLAAEGNLVKATCQNCSAENEFPAYLSSGKCGACGSGIPLGANAVPVPGTPPEFIELNRRLEQKLGYPLPRLIEANTNLKRQELQARGIDPAVIEDALYQGCLAAKAATEPPTINEVICSRCGGINRVSSAPPPEGHSYMCGVCKLPLTSTDPHQSYVDRHNELAKQSHSWQVWGGVSFLLIIILYACQAASIRSTP